MIMEKKNRISIQIQPRKELNQKTGTDNTTSWSNQESAEENVSRNIGFEEEHVDLVNDWDDGWHRDKKELEGPFKQIEQTDLELAAGEEASNELDIFPDHEHTNNWKTRDNRDNWRYKESWDRAEEDEHNIVIPLRRFQSRKLNDSWDEQAYVQKDTRGPGGLFRKFKTSSKVFLTAGAAIGVGILIGMMVLSVFSNFADIPVSQKTNNPSPDKTEATTVVGDEEAASLDGATLEIIPSGNVQDGTVQLPTRSYYVVQAGAFSELESGRRTLDIHKSNGWAGLLLEEGTPYRFYIGLAGSKEDAGQLSAYYNNQGVETYVKEHLTPHVKGAKVQVEENVLQLLPGFLTKGDQLIIKLGKVTAAGIQDPTYTLSLEEWKSIQELHMTFLQEGKQLFSKWDGEEKKYGEQMVHNLNSGVNALEAFRKKQHVSYLWQVQQSSLNYLNEYENLVANLN
jgi:hypothetical protein